MPSSVLLRIVVPIDRKDRPREGTAGENPRTEEARDMTTKGIDRIVFDISIDCSSSKTVDT